MGGLKGYLVVLYTVCFFVFMVSGARHNEKITAMASFKVYAYLDPVYLQEDGRIHLRKLYA